MRATGSLKRMQPSLNDPNFIVGFVGVTTNPLKKSEVEFAVRIDKRAMDTSRLRDGSSIYGRIAGNSFILDYDAMKKKYKRNKR